jgi:hypothetical protein
VTASEAYLPLDQDRCRLRVKEAVGVVCGMARASKALKDGEGAAWDAQVDRYGNFTFCRDPVTCLSRECQ